MTIKIATISGSVRPDNYTAKALAIVIAELRKHPDVLVEDIDLGDIDLPLPGRPLTDPKVKALQEKVKDADGVVIATPEYHGSFSSLIKLAIENLGYPNALKGKPIAMLGVAGGRIGAIKSLEHLRSVCSHVGALVLPNLVSIARVKEKIDQTGAPTSEETARHLRGLGDALLCYIEEAVCPKYVLESMVRVGQASQK